MVFLYFEQILPPPNVTGVLHIGHALTLSIEDSIIRYKKMNGFNTFFLPGFDHSGIATQAVVMKSLLKENIKISELSDDELYNKINEWSNNHRDIIREQFKKMGSVLDWNNEYFTLNDKHSKAVENAFIKLYNDNIIYRNKRIVNWCPALQSTISDIEIEYDVLINLLLEY